MLEMIEWQARSSPVALAIGFESIAGRVVSKQEEETIKVRVLLLRYKKHPLPLQGQGPSLLEAIKFYGYGSRGSMLWWKRRLLPEAPEAAITETSLPWTNQKAVNTTQHLSSVSKSKLAKLAAAIISLKIETLRPTERD